MSYFCLNLGQTAEDSAMFTIIWLHPRGLRKEGEDTTKKMITMQVQGNRRRGGPRKYGLEIRSEDMKEYNND